MKLIKTICWVLMLSCAILVFAEKNTEFDQTILLMFKNVEHLANEAELQRNDSRVLVRIHFLLKKYLKRAQYCRANASEKINFLNDKNQFFQTSFRDQYLLNQKRLLQSSLERYQEELNLCSYLNFRINMLIKKIDNYKQMNYLSSFYKKYPSFLETIHRMQRSKFAFVPRGYIVQIVSSSTNISKNIQTLVGIFVLLTFLKYFGGQRFFLKVNFQQIHLTKFIYICSIFIFISPVQYLFLKTIFNHQDNVLIILYQRPGHILINLCVLMYLYLFLQYSSFKKFFGMMIYSLIFEWGLFILCLSIYYFDLHAIHPSQSLFYRYLILFDLIGISSYIFYWLFNHIMDLKVFKNPTIIFIIGILFLAFLLGMRGYLDLAINVYFTVILFSIIFVFTTLFYRIKKILIDKLNHPTEQITYYLHKLFLLDEGTAVFNIKFFIQFVFYIVLIEVIVISIISLIWFSPKDIMREIYAFIYQEQSVNNFQFVVINYITAIISFIVLNVFNLYCSNHLASKIVYQGPLKSKMVRLFYWVGLLLILLICLLITKIQVQKFFYLFGGLLLGIGLGLRNVLTNLFSSLILYTNRPFEVGDLVSISSTKGYVKKIGVLETFIETLDKDVVILPNQFIAGTAIENYTYDGKQFHRVHLKYLIEHYHLEKEIIIQNAIFDVFAHSKWVSDIKNYPPQFIFSPDNQSSENYQLEIIFAVNTLKRLNGILMDINKKIILAVEKKTILLRFVSVSHPMISN